MVFIKYNPGETQRKNTQRAAKKENVNLPLRFFAYSLRHSALKKLHSFVHI